MKTLISLFFAAFLCVATATADDASFVANWQFPVAYWFPNGPIPATGIDNIPRAQALADSIANFDPTAANFDAVWSSLSLQGTSGAGYPIAHTTGNPASDHGAADFTGAFKVAYDHSNLYVFVQYLDDYVTQSEGTEIMWAPYLSIPPIEALASAIATGHQVQASHARWAQFGAYKADFTYSGAVSAEIFDFDATGKGNLHFAATNPIIANNLSMSDYTAPGSHTVKKIYTIGFQALTGNAYAAPLNARPDFNTTIWKALNNGQGISFDIHFIDVDTDDALNTANPPKATPQEYWWNSTSNEGWCETYYSGFLGVRSTSTAVNQVYSKNSIFGARTSDQIRLTKTVDVKVYSLVGKLLLSLNNTNNVDLSNLNKGVYIIRANNETLKFER